MPTRCNNILDLVLARGFVNVTAQPRPGTHDEVVISLIARSPPPIRVTRAAAFNYRRADFDALRRVLRATPWDLLDHEGVDEAVSMFYKLVDAAVRDHIPAVVFKKRFPPWFRPEIRHALKLKQAAFERLKRHPAYPDCRADFVRKRADFKRLSQLCMVSRHP